MGIYVAVRSSDHSSAIARSIREANFACARGLVNAICIDYNTFSVIWSQECKHHVSPIAFVNARNLFLKTSILHVNEEPVKSELNIYQLEIIGDDFLIIQWQEPL